MTDIALIVDSETERINYQQNENMICPTLDRAVNKMTSHGKFKTTAREMKVSKYMTLTRAHIISTRGQILLNCASRRRLN